MRRRQAGVRRRRFLSAAVGADVSGPLGNWRRQVRIAPRVGGASCSECLRLARLCIRIVSLFICFCVLYVLYYSCIICVCDSGALSKMLTRDARRVCSLEDVDWPSLIFFNAFHCINVLIL